MGLCQISNSLLLPPNFFFNSPNAKQNKKKWLYLFLGEHLSVCSQASDNFLHHFFGLPTRKNSLSQTKNFDKLGQKRLPLRFVSDEKHWKNCGRTQPKKAYWRHITLMKLHPSFRKKKKFHGLQRVRNRSRYAQFFGVRNFWFWFLLLCWWVVRKKISRKNEFMGKFVCIKQTWKNNLNKITESLGANFYSPKNMPSS